MGRQRKEASGSGGMSRRRRRSRTLALVAFVAMKRSGSTELSSGRKDRPAHGQKEEPADDGREMSYQHLVARRTGHKNVRGSRSNGPPAFDSLHNVGKVCLLEVDSPLLQYVEAGVPLAAHFPRDFGDALPSIIAEVDLENDIAKSSREDILDPAMGKYRLCHLLRPIGIDTAADIRPRQRWDWDEDRSDDDVDDVLAATAHLLVES
ncbi:uncharacterized protein PSFLO_02221 [Pseudozyma flocculosa]|uniref:Uncharacterized protein n=1 Tax=Pseudozyma flocculosa TaxID=84751 RepID=A0A5C3EXY7_9BASI|nr:uncharacterized protein PSFLO_02221 [Pseudozyma flocculosa]